MNQFLTDLIIKAPVAIISGVLTFFAYHISRLYWQRILRFRLLKQAEEYARKRGNRVEVALIASVTSDIEEAARNYLKKIGCEDIPILKVHQDEVFPPREEAWIAYLDQFKNEVKKTREMGASRVYLFTNVPVAMAVLLGAVLRNGPEAIIHHYDGRGQYYPIGPLVTETVVI